MSARRRLSNRHANESISFMWLGLQFTATIARFPDGAVAELFISNGKIDSHADVMARDAAVAASLALQFGCPLEVLQRALLRDPRGVAASALGTAIDRIADDGGAR
jgi:ribonucleoside-diphosphate reductase alpha chain